MNEAEKYIITIESLRNLGFEVSPDSFSVLIYNREVPIEKIVQKGLASVLLDIPQPISGKKN
ncbi:MAG: hypothetical protein NUW37_10080 [Planctomycetes bacterium]|nr:hypothetical protein [Planctomycetota bacterium]